ncbi:hypothetical protein DT87_11760 [Streptomyces sp. NTK 937]|nr:hypothetical protein [Streptomyces sp. NTK 937]KDQ67857.1 hypothetical protein DT87_11760 [Streptomyces sp. NTK 937]
MVPSSLAQPCIVLTYVAYLVGRRRVPAASRLDQPRAFNERKTRSSRISARSHSEARSSTAANHLVKNERPTPLTVNWL